MIVSFVSYSTSFPSGGNLAIYEFANGLSRRGHEVHVIHRGNLLQGGWVQSLDDLRWCSFEDDVTHHWADYWQGEDRYPGADFIFRYDPEIPERAGLPVALVQGDLTGTQADRMLWPCPKVCVARWLVDVGRRSGAPEHELVHVPYGIRHDKYRLTAPIPGRPPRVAMLHHPHPRKGSRFGLAALEEVRRRVPAVEAVLFGTRPRPEAIPEWIDYAQLPPQDVLVDDVYNGSRIFVQPSVREGFGFAAVEAMACGCALVTSDNGGSADYARDGESALVTPRRAPMAMADAIERLVVDEQEAARLATAGRDFAVATFDWDVSAGKLEEFLRAYGASPEHYRSSPPGSALA